LSVALVAVLLSLAGAGTAAARPLAASSNGARTVAAAASPSLTLSIPQVAGDSCGACLPNSTIAFLSSQGTTTAPATVTATLPAGVTINPSLIFIEWAPAGTGDWSSPRFPKTFSGTGPYTGALSYASFPTAPALAGVYDLRVGVQDSSGQTDYSQPIQNVVIDNDFQRTYVAVGSPGQTVHGTVTFLASAERPGGTFQYEPDTVQFEVCQVNVAEPCSASGVGSPTSGGNWAPVGAPATPVLDGSGNPILINGQQEYEVNLDTTQVADGNYDVTIEPQGGVPPTALCNGSPPCYVSNVATFQVVNTPPTVTLANPGASLSGVVPLTATVTSSAAIASLRFEYAHSDAGPWSTIGVVSEPPYGVSFDTRGLQNGVYVLRAVATDVAGNSAVSEVPDISVANPGGAAGPPSFAVTPTVAPASGTSQLAAGGGSIKLLGEISGSEHETWGYGYTTAPAPTVDGSPLPYTSPHGVPQLVMLRYTDSGGWQIADVLRNADGTPFVLPSGAQISGQMTASGEAWMIVNQAQGPVALFHRVPGGHFLLDSEVDPSGLIGPQTDPGADAMLESLFANQTRADGVKLTLGEDASGGVYGLLVDPGQAPSPTSTALNFGEFIDGQWSIETADVPPNYQPADGTVTLTAASATGPGAGWAVFAVPPDSPEPQPLMLGSFSTAGAATTWSWVTHTGLDALDVTGGLGSVNAVANGQGILAASDGVWISASVLGAPVIALYDPQTGHLVRSWCDPAVAARSVGCGDTIDANDPATLPSAVFDTAQGPVGLALGSQAVDVYANGSWTAVAAPGFDSSNGDAIFTSPTDGWLAGGNSLGRITAAVPPAALAEWPQANQATLVSVALPPAGAAISTSGALAVGLEGTALHYDSTNGWLVDPVPDKARGINLLGVAYDGQSQAVAVGALGTILDWNGTSWSADPQSGSLTQNQLNAVAFGSDGQGWAVGSFGTILHYDGTAWSQEQVDAQDDGVNITSVTVAGDQAYAIAGGNLIERGADGTWSRVDLSSLPVPMPAGALTLVSGLPDGGVVAAGHSVVIVRQDGSSSFSYSAQPIQGIAVGLAAFRDPGSGDVRAFVSVAPPVVVQGIGGFDVAGFPAGDGELLKQTPTGWEDLSQSQSPFVGSGSGLPVADGLPQPDPVLGVAAASDGSAAWAVGGYAGTQTAAGLGTSQPLQARAFAWQTASIWRYDQGGSVPAPTLSQALVNIPAQPNTVSFAFLSSAECVSECSQVQNAQPDVNLAGAAGEINAFASQPGGPAIAILGGNAVGPTNASAQSSGDGAVDLANLHKYLAPLAGVPLYAAYGPLDPVPSFSDPAQPWDDAFAQSPAPFGPGPAPSSVTPVGAGGFDGSVNHYYAYDVAQNGGTLRVIVLDNSAGSLDDSEPGQTAWLAGQLTAAQTANVPVVAVVAQPLDSGLTGSAYQSPYATDADQIASMLANAGVLAVFTTSPTQSDQTHMVPNQNPNRPPVGAQIPEYEGAAVGYQQTQNNGVLWYFVSVDTAQRTVTVQGIPVITSLALEPLSGLTAARSSTLSFRAVGRRPAGTLTATPDQSNPQGIANYVAIPSPSCSTCVTPSYSFASSDPLVGDFVVPSGAGSQFPKLSASGKTTPSSTSGLFCAFNPGQTTVSVTSGLLTASQTVTVEPGNIGQPCGTVPDLRADRVVVVAGRTVLSTAAAPNGSPAPAPAPVVKQPSPKIKLGHKFIPPPPAAAKVPPVAPKPAPSPSPSPPPASAPAPPPAKAPAPKPQPPLPQHQVHPPAPVSSFISPAAASAAAAAVIVPLTPPPITPVPPGGATAPAQSTSRREERARKHASQSAYVTRPAGTSAEEWFYPAVGVMTVVALLLIGAGVRPGPGRRPAFVELRAYDEDPRVRRRRS
jgi:hypothetical protein